MDEEVIETEKQLFLTEVLERTLNADKTKVQEAFIFVKQSILNEADNGNRALYYYPLNGWHDTSGKYMVLASNEQAEIVVNLIQDEGFHVEYSAVNHFYLITWNLNTNKD